MKLPLLVASLVGAVAATPCAPAAPTTAHSSTGASEPTSAAARPNDIPDGTPFGLLSLRSASPVHLAPFSAANGGLSILDPAGNQGATCASTTPATAATFVLANGQLFLYTPPNNVTQLLYTDRSGMGQGVLQYATAPGGYGLPRNAETTGWTVRKSNGGDLPLLEFDGAGLLACPSVANSTQGPWRIFVSAGVTNPAGYEGCLSILGYAVVSPEPIPCTYSFTPAPPQALV